MRPLLVPILALAACTTPTTTAAGSNDWNRFRGPDGAGRASTTARLPAVLDRASNLAWSSPVPPGASSPCVVRSRVFVTGHEKGELVTVCLDLASGKPLWRRAVEARGEERLHDINSPAAPTPTSDGERVFAYFGTFGVIAYDLAGNELWRREQDVPKNTFGSAASLVLVEDRLVQCYDSNEASWLAALDPKTGDTLWHVEREGFGSGWSTPGVWRHDGVTELLVYGVWWLNAYDLRDGSVRWSVPGLSDEPIVTPIAGDGMVYVTSYNMRISPEVLGVPPFAELLAAHDADGDGALSRDEAAGNKSILSRSDADGEGDHPLSIFFRFLDEDRSDTITAVEFDKIFRWLDTFEHENALIALAPGGAGDGSEATGASSPQVRWQVATGVPECPSPLFADGRVYMVKNGGLFTCVDAATGTIRYQERTGARGPCYASPVAGDGKIYTASARGVVMVLRAGDRFEVLARNELGERIMATPALVDGTVIVRTEANVLAFRAGD